jgi:hypothetical protein
MQRTSARVSLVASDAGWAAVNSGLLGLRALLSFALMLIPITGALLFMPWAAVGLAGMVKIVALVLIGAAVAGLLLAVSMLRQLYRLTRAPNSALARWAWLAFGAFVLELASLVASVKFGATFQTVASVLYAVCSVGLTVFLIQLDKELDAEAHPLWGVLLMLGPGLLLQLLEVAEARSRSLKYALAEWSLQHPMLQAGLSLLALGIIIAGILLLRGSLSKLSEALE